jgi:NAD(P)-dependent dehydrogenase (short-subunit alcohol dehydrogenase family)
MGMADEAQDPATAAMTDRVVVITGATGDLGPVVARRFAEAGARCALLARDEDACIGVVMSLPGAIRRHRAVPVDLSDAASARAAAATVREKLGAASVLLHLVGGYAGGKPFPETDDDELAQQLELNLWTTARAIRAFLPDIAAAANGRIVTMSTFVASAPTAKHAAYAASKAAAEALTISVAKDLSGTTATANIVVVRAIGAEKPTETRPEEIAGAMLWLCSPEAGATTGQRINLFGRA